MDTILDMTKVFLSSICFRLFPIDVACDNFFWFVSGYGGDRHHLSKTIFQCNYPTRKKYILSHATSVGNKGKQTEDRNVFVISNIVSIVSSPLKKQIKMKLCVAT